MRASNIIFTLSLCIIASLTISIKDCWCQINLDNNFLSSTIGTERITVEEFIDIIQNVKMSNGKHPKISGWSRKNNIYTLKVHTTSELKFIFEHMLNYSGKMSLLDVTIDGEPANALLTLMRFASMPRDQTKADKKRLEQKKESDLREQEQDKINKKQQQEAKLKEAQAEQRRIDAHKKQEEEYEVRKKQLEQERIIAVHNNNTELLYRMNGELIWTSNGRPAIGIEKYINVNIKSDYSAEVHFVSRNDNSVICKIVDNDAKIDLEKSTIIASEGDCSIRIEPMGDLVTLEYRGKCEQQCPPSKYTHNGSEAYPNGYYVLKKKNQEAIEREKMRRENSWK